MKTQIKFIFSIGILLTSLACQKSDDGGGSPAAGQGLVGGSDPIHGTWVYINPTSTESKIKGMAATLNPDGSVTILNMYIQPSGNNATMIFRRSVGTYKRNGDLIELKYTYETCNPVGSETFKAVIDPKNRDKLLVSTLDGSVFFTMTRSKEGESDITFTGVEDKNCNLISKIVKQNRMPASVKSVLGFSKVN